MHFVKVQIINSVVYCRYARMYAVIMHSCTSSLVVRMHISFPIIDSIVCLVLNNFLIYYIFGDKDGFTTNRILIFK